MFNTEILDDLGKKVTKVSQTTINGAKELAGTAKIKFMISEEEKRLNHLYAELGKSYLALHSKDADESLQPIIKSIDAQKVKIFDLQEELK